MLHKNIILFVILASVTASYSSPLPSSMDWFKRTAVPKISVWPNQVLPYTISMSLHVNPRILIRAAFCELQDESCLKFKPRTTETAYVSFEKVDDNSGCSSLLGRQGNKQIIGINTKCNTTKEVLDLIVDALGLKMPAVGKRVLGAIPFMNRRAISNGLLDSATAKQLRNLYSCKQPNLGKARSCTNKKAGCYYDSTHTDSCESNVKFMKDYCKKQCGFCGLR